MRVPLDQSGAASAARWIARSGWRPASARVRPRQPRGEHERLDVRAAAGGGDEELQVGARVGLHRARDVAQHHEPPRQDPPPPAREPQRLAAGAQARAQGAPQVDVAAVARRARGGACAAAASRPRAAPSAGRAARARPASSSSKRLPASRSSSLASATRHVELLVVVARGAVRRRGRRPALGRLRRHVLVRRGLGRPRPEHLGEHAVERLHLRLVGDEHRARRPVQPPPRHRPHERPARARRPPRGRASSARRRRAGAARAPRRAAAGRGRSSRRRSAVTAAARAGRGRPRGSPPGPRRT